MIRNSTAARTVMGTKDLEMPKRRWVWHWDKCIPLVALLTAPVVMVFAVIFLWLIQWGK